jgi:hypothetical protein
VSASKSRPRATSTPKASSPRAATPPKGPDRKPDGELGGTPVDHDAHPSTSGYGTSAPDACSVLWDHDGTSAYGTAAQARFFVILEQSGPWGRDAARESHLDRDLGAEIDARTIGAGGRFMLVRRPGGHPDHAGARQVFLAYAGGAPGDAWLLGAQVTDIGGLLGLDWAALARGSEALVRASLPGAEPADPALLVCTNGRRDVCCAVRGRPLAAHAARVAPGRVWEVSHTGGHRFAPTAVLLPWGQTYARIDDQTAEWVLEASRTAHTPKELLGTVHDRGRSGLAAPAQSAESHVRAEIGETHLPSVWAGEPRPAGDGFDVTVAHADGRTWEVRVERVPAGRTRPESCGKAAVEVLEHRATITAGA